VLNLAAAVAANSSCGWMGDLGLGRDSCSLVVAVVDDAEGGVVWSPSIMFLSGPGGVITTSNGARDDGGSPCPGPVQLRRLVLRWSPVLGQLLLALALLVMPDAMPGFRNVPCGLQMPKLLFLAELSGPPWTTVPSAGWVI
jgi:hypothetical protein